MGSTPMLPPPLSTPESTLESTLESTTPSPPSTAITTASVRLRPSPRLMLRPTLSCTPLESTLPLLPPPTPTELLPLLSAALSLPSSAATSPPLPSTLTSPPPPCTPTLLPLLCTLESTPESTLVSTTDSLPSTATTTDKSLEDREPKAIGPNVAPWW